MRGGAQGRSKKRALKEVVGEGAKRGLGRRSREVVVRKVLREKVRGGSEKRFRLIFVCLFTELFIPYSLLYVDAAL